jgi:deoxyribonuclease V
VTAWPHDPAALLALQEALGRERPAPFAWSGPAARAGGCAVVFARGAEGRGAPDEPAFAAAAVLAAGALVASAVHRGAAPAAFAAGALALREGPLLAAAVRGLDPGPEVLLVHAAGRDHPRRAGLALHLGWALGVPTVGVTETPLVARAAPPAAAAGAASPLVLDGERVGYLVRPRAGALPVAAHAGWRTTPEQAAEIVLALATAARTPEPLRAALRLAREARAEGGGLRPP